MTIYADYQRDRIGWFFGLSGGQLMFLALASLPAFWAISRGAWFSAFLFALVWLFLLGITVIRPFPPMIHHLRVSVGLPEEMDKFMKAFKEIFPRRDSSTMARG